MRTKASACLTATALLAAVAPGGVARAETPRAMFCVAIRTAPLLDQDNYVMGARGPVYMTKTFTTDLSDDALRAAWQAAIGARHPVRHAGNPDDDCHPARDRRGMIEAQKGEIRNLSVDWAP